MEERCFHTCKGSCRVLNAAELREREAVADYSRVREECDYPEVRTLLDELIRNREDSLGLLAKTREALNAKFRIVDNVTESFRTE